MTDIHSCSYYCDKPECIKAQRDELRDKLSEVAAAENSLHREPVGYINPNTKQFEWAKPISFNVPMTITVPTIPLYINPTDRAWVGLTPSEVHDIWAYNHTPHEICDAIEAILKEKNSII